MNWRGVIGAKSMTPDRIAAERTARRSFIGKRFLIRRNGTRKTTLIPKIKPRILGASSIGIVVD